MLREAHRIKAYSLDRIRPLDHRDECTMNTSDQAAGQMAAARNRIVHSFARWTALSALRSGCPVKSRAKIYPLLDALDFNALFDHSLGAIDAASFAIWHRASVDYLSSRSRHDSRLGVGWAAKLVNVYLKTSVYVGGSVVRDL